MSLQPCAFCEEGSCDPYCSFRSVLTADPENREKAQKLLRCIPKTRLESLFTRAVESEVKVEEVVQGLLVEIHERNLYPVTGIQRKLKDVQNLLKIANTKMAKAQNALTYYQREV
ncbi:hypothetical protein Tco_0288934, partial [Tanacetum coccineum]